MGGVTCWVRAVPIGLGGVVHLGVEGASHRPRGPAGLDWALQVGVEVWEELQTLEDLRECPAPPPIISAPMILAILLILTGAAFPPSPLTALAPFPHAPRIHRGFPSLPSSLPPFLPSSLLPPPPPLRPSDQLSHCWQSWPFTRTCGRS